MYVVVPSTMGAIRSGGGVTTSTSVASHWAMLGRALGPSTRGARLRCHPAEMTAQKSRSSPAAGEALSVGPPSQAALTFRDQTKLADAVLIRPFAKKSEQGTFSTLSVGAFFR